MANETSTSKSSTCSTSLNFDDLSHEQNYVRHKYFNRDQTNNSCLRGETNRDEIDKVDGEGFLITYVYVGLAVEITFG